MSAAVRALEPPQVEYYDFGLPSVDDLEVAAAAAMADVVPAAPSASAEDESMDADETSGSDADSGSSSVADEQVLRLAGFASRLLLPSSRLVLTAAARHLMAKLRLLRWLPRAKKRAARGQLAQSSSLKATPSDCTSPCTALTWGHAWTPQQLAQRGLALWMFERDQPFCRSRSATPT